MRFLRSAAFLASLIFALGSSASWAADSYDGGHAPALQFANSLSSQDFTSTINGRPYRLYISVPNTPPPERGFPVLYLLDGDLFFGMAVDILAIQQEQKNLIPAIMVGIGYPVHTAAEFRNYRGKDFSSDEILRVIEREIKPRIAKVAPVDTGNQALFGEATAGSTVFRALFTEPAAFQTFVASSPSIRRDEALSADLVRLSNAIAAGNIQPRILLEAGELETKVREGIGDIERRLGGIKGGANYVFKTVVFADESHVSTMPAAVSRALTFALGPKR